MTINGSGFTAGASVNFSLQSPVAGSYDPQIPAAVVANPAPGCALPTCIQVTSPAISKGLAYTVTVTTPGGTSQTSTNDFTNFVPTFTYTPADSDRHGLTGNVNGGNITGGTPVTIIGTSFWSSADNSDPAQVFFCPQLERDVPPRHGPERHDANGGFESRTQMTALSPAVSASGTYYIQVMSYGLTSTQTNVTFTYAVQVPLVTSLSPSSGATGSTLTINGTNFLSGATVGFCATGNINWTTYTCNTATTSATIVTVTPNAITLTVPSMTAGTYIPFVTVTGADPSQPYDEATDIFTHIAHRMACSPGKATHAEIAAPAVLQSGDCGQVARAFRRTIASTAWSTLLAQGRRGRSATTCIEAIVVETLRAHPRRYAWSDSLPGLQARDQPHHGARDLAGLRAQTLA